MTEQISSKSKIVALILCLFFWYLGIHKFYLGQPLGGILYLLGCIIFCVLLGWLVVPFLLYLVIGGLIAAIEFIILLFMPTSQFNAKFR